MQNLRSSMTGMGNGQTRSQEMQVAAYKMISATDHMGNVVRWQEWNRLTTLKNEFTSVMSVTYGHTHSLLLWTLLEIVSCHKTGGRERDRKNPQLAETSSLEGRSLAIKSFISCFLWQINETSATWHMGW